MACPPGTAPQYSVQVTRDVFYALGYVSDGVEPMQWEQKELLLDVYEPENDERSERPALVLVHGGSFSEGSKEKEEIVEYAEFFAERGFVCFAMNYRLNGDHPPAPGYWDTLSLTAAAHAAMVDVKAAICFVRAEAEVYGVDPDLVALLGESAGAIAGVTAAVTNPDEYTTDGPEFPVPEENHPGESPRVRAYVHLWGSADHVLLKVGPGDPPTMIVHGTEDDNLITPFSAAERFHGLLEFWDIPHEFYAAEGFGHGAWDYRLRGRGVKLLTLDFINEHLLGVTKPAPKSDFTRPNQPHIRVFYRGTTARVSA